jgi:predicted regulator of Ras-like GTPase activity (Roadblock/LC7/MglB family)
LSLTKKRQGAFWAFKEVQMENSHPVAKMLIEAHQGGETGNGGNGMTKHQEMESLLTQVVKENGLDGAVIADIEGLPLASHLPPSVDEDELAAASAAILSISDSKLTDGEKGGVVQLSVESVDGYLVIKEVKGEYVISVVAPKSSKLGIVLSAVRSIERRL